MAALLVSLAIMGLMMAMALPVWHHAAKREREAELIFRGEQYARAVELWQRQRPGAAPPDIDTLVDQRFLRKKYLDPMTEDGEFQLVLQSQMGAVPGEGAATAASPGQLTGQSSPGGLAPRGIGGMGGLAVGGLGTRDLGQRSGQLGRSTSGGPGGVAGGIVGVVSKSEETSMALYNGRSKYNEWAFVYTPDVQAGAAPEPAAPGALGQPGLGAGGGFGQLGSGQRPRGSGGGTPSRTGRLGARRAPSRLTTGS